MKMTDISKNMGGKINLTSLGSRDMHPISVFIASGLCIILTLNNIGIL